MGQKATGGRQRERIMMGFLEARDLIRRHVQPMAAEEVCLASASLRSLAEDVVARVDSPTHDVSQKDGFCLVSSDTAAATETGPVTLRCQGARFAGGLSAADLDGELSPGSAVRLTSGAVLPGGADAVVGEEYCTMVGEEIRVISPVPAGMNVLSRGADVRAGAVVARKGAILTPGMVGWMAAAGIDRVRVTKRPHAALVATGDEVVLPGSPLRPGQLYASNLCGLAAWLDAFGMSFSIKVLPDRESVLAREMLLLLDAADVLITSGGARGSDRDLVVPALRGLGWVELFHGVRLGPGKAAGFGLLRGKPVFCLPGGPPSSEMAFLQLALPGLLRLAGRCEDPFTCLEARLTEPIHGRGPDWTQIRHGRIEQDSEGVFRVTPYRPASRMQSMALAECLIVIPEGVERLGAGERVRVQVLPFPRSGFAE